MCGYSSMGCLSVFAINRISCLEHNVTNTDSGTQDLFRGGCLWELSLSLMKPQYQNQLNFFWITFHSVDDCVGDTELNYNAKVNFVL